MTSFVTRYGASPWHLAGMLACLALAAYAGSLLLGEPSVVRMLLWFAGAVVLHDVVLFPLYAAGDRLLATGVTRLPRSRVPIVNHIRLPVLGAGLTFLLFLPGIVGQGGATHLDATGLDQSPYPARWLLLVAALFTVSAAIWLIRTVTTR